MHIRIPARPPSQPHSHLPVIPLSSESIPFYLVFCLGQNAVALILMSSITHTVKDLEQSANTIHEENYYIRCSDGPPFIYTKTPCQIQKALANIATVDDDSMPHSPAGAVENIRVSVSSLMLKS